METTQETTTPDITWFTPSVGATSTNCVLFNLLQNHSLICALICKFLQSLKAAHTIAGLYAHSCRSFLNLLTKTLCAHSCRGRPRTQLGLNLFLYNQP